MIIVCLSRTASRSHFGFRNWSGAHFILILTDLEKTLSEEKSLALDNFRPSEGSAQLGWDLRQMGSGALLDCTVSAMSRARVWTNSFTLAGHIQQEAIAQEGPSHSKELGHLLETVAQGEASDRAVQFARGLHDTAAEELLASSHTFVTTGCREPDLAEELDRADEAAEAEVDEEICITCANDSC